MSWLVIGFAMSGWLAAAALGLFLPARARRRSHLRTQLLRTQVEPYLRRRAAELELPRDTSTDPSQSTDQVVKTLCQLASQLQEKEKAQISLGDTLEMAMSQTQPLPSSLPDQD